MAAAILDARTRPADGGLGTYDVENFREVAPSLIERLWPPDLGHGTYDVQAYPESLLDAPPVLMGAGGIPSAEAIGTASLTLEINGTGIPTAEAIGGATLTPSGPAAPVTVDPSAAMRSRRSLYTFGIRR